jgi:DNA-binding transcriptional MerR regulator
MKPNAGCVKIREFAQAAGMSTHTVRFYESEGILPKPERSHSGIRQYCEDDIVLLRCVAMLRRLGMSLSDLRSLVDSVARAKGCVVEGEVNTSPEIRAHFWDVLQTHHDRLLADREELNRLIGFTEQLLQAVT